MIDAAAGNYSSHLIEQQVTAIGEWDNSLAGSVDVGAACSAGE